MRNFKYFRITKNKKIRYLKIFKRKGTYIVFLHGFMSDLEGKKPKAFLNFSKKYKLGFLALEYSGHGKSSGKFVDGNISKWSRETSFLIKKIVKKNNIILIGSSMGAWIALNQILKFKQQIKGFVGIGSAPEFLENLMWKKFSNKMKKEFTNSFQVLDPEDISNALLFALNTKWKTNISLIEILPTEQSPGGIPIIPVKDPILE